MVEIYELGLMGVANFKSGSWKDGEKQWRGKSGNVDEVIATSSNLCRLHISDCGVVLYGYQRGIKRSKQECGRSSKDGRKLKV